jgi:hypothetical protein
MMPMGMSRCGFFASCAAVLTASKPMYAHARARRNERMPVGGIDCVSRAEDEQQYDRHFHKHDYVVYRRRFANADHQQQRDDGNDDDGWQIEDGSDLRSIRQSNERTARRR